MLLLTGTILPNSQGSGGLSEALVCVKIDGFCFLMAISPPSSLKRQKRYDSAVLRLDGRLLGASCWDVACGPDF
jgi:hypothetical protein